MGALPLRQLKQHYLGLLGTTYLLIWLGLSIHPLYRQDWLLENLLIFIALPIIAASIRWFRLSNLSYTLIFIFLSLHTLGAHYTYAEVPYDQWAKGLTGHTLSGALGWQRNHYDRLVHFCYGLMLAYPVREMFMRFVAVRGFLAYFLPLDLTMSTSMLYELLEWAAAELFGGDLGLAYLGTQGDVWDAQKDMALASLGALIAMLITAYLNYRKARR
ncbi:MAG TPA: DUF2238 domain-containing protein [Methylophilaceae bacterium]|nr:DUF2238 domain-containing protein [Methylophilaceae bacterium]